MILQPEILSLGDAKGGIKTTTTPKGSTRAKAYEVQIVKNVIERQAGGTQTLLSQHVEFVKDLGAVPYDVVSTFTKYATTPGLVYTIYNEGKKTKTQIETRMQTDPQFKQDVESVVNKIKTTGSDILSTVTDPIVSTSKLITWLPYMLVFGLVVLGYAVVKNPGSISTPRKVSLL